MVGDCVVLLGRDTRGDFHAVFDNWRDDWTRIGKFGEFGFGGKCVGIDSHDSVFVRRNAIAFDRERSRHGNDRQPRFVGLAADGRIGTGSRVAAILSENVLSRSFSAV